MWFAVAWQLATAKNGVSALGVQRSLGMASYQTTYAMLHRLRAAMVGPGRDRLSGLVGRRGRCSAVCGPVAGGRGAEGKALIGVAVKHTGEKGFGRCCLQVIPDAGAVTLTQFLADRVEPGPRVLTDGWTAYGPATADAYTHERYVAPGPLAHELLPGVHWVISLAKRCLLGAHQGAVEIDHPQAYLDEFTFRFNRRRSRSPGLLFYRLLEQAVAHDPLRYREIVANPGAGSARTPRPPGGGGRPASLQRAPADRPWRWG